MQDRRSGRVINQARASELAKEGFDLWQAGQLDAAVPKYVAALELADPNHYALPDYSGEFAGVLAALGRDADALKQYQLSLAESVRQDPAGTSAGVGVATYFLSEHLLKINNLNEALDVIQRSPCLLSKHEWHLRIIEARALWELGREREAKRSAQRAIERAPSEEKAAELREQLAGILSHAG